MVRSIIAIKAQTTPYFSWSASVSVPEKMTVESGGTAHEWDALYPKLQRLSKYDAPAGSAASGPRESLAPSQAH